MVNSLPLRASVIIVSYNSRKYLGTSLPDILGSLGDRDELILVDNASTDGTVEWVRGAFPSIQLVISDTNLGFGGANNLGVKQASGQFVVFINPDTRVEHGWLDALIHALEASPEIQLVTSRIVQMDDPGRINTCGNEVHISGITLCRGIGRPRDEMSTAGQVGAVSGAAFAMRRSSFLELGGYDPDFFLYMEDTDLSFRARLAGGKINFVPESIVEHAYKLNFGSSKVFFQERNRYLLLLKHFRWKTLLVLVPVLLLGEVVTWGFVLLRERSQVMNKLQAYLWVIRKWKLILAKRSQLQPLRRVPDRVLVAEMPSRLDISQIESSWLGRFATATFWPLFALLKVWSRLWIWW